LILTIIVSNTSFCQVTTEEANDLLVSVSKQTNSKLNGSIIESNNEKPEKLASYLSQLKMEDVEVNSYSHIKLDTKQNAGIIDIYILQYSKDTSKYLVFVENKIDLAENNAIKLSIDFTKDTAKLTSYETSLVKTGGVALKKNWSKCFGNCLAAGLDSSGLIGQVIIIGGGLSFICPVCGAVAGVYTSIVILGCAGGCM